MNIIVLGYVLNIVGILVERIYIGIIAPGDLGTLALFHDIKVKESRRKNRQLEAILESLIPFYRLFMTVLWIFYFQKNSKMFGVLDCLKETINDMNTYMILKLKRLS